MRIQKIRILILKDLSLWFYGMNLRAEVLKGDPEVHYSSWDPVWPSRPARRQLLHLC